MALYTHEIKFTAILTCVKFPFCSGGSSGIVLSFAILKRIIMWAILSLL